MLAAEVHLKAPIPNMSLSILTIEILRKSGYCGHDTPEGDLER